MNDWLVFAAVESNCLRSSTEGINSHCVCKKSIDLSKDGSKNTLGKFSVLSN